MRNKLMKYALFVVVLGAILGGIYLFTSNETVTYVAQDPIEVVKEVEVNPLDGQIKQREKELEELYRNAQNLEASIDVREAEIARLEAQNVEDRKALASFIQAIGSKD
jgi:hypothetical protein